jgi:hypothetical protein
VGYLSPGTTLLIFPAKTSQIASWAGLHNNFSGNQVVSTGQYPNGNWVVYATSGINRYNPEGNGWAQNNSFSNNISGAMNASTEARKDYQDLVPGKPEPNWSNNTHMPSGAITAAEAGQVYMSIRQPALSANNIEIGPSW